MSEEDFRRHGVMTSWKIDTSREEGYKFPILVDYEDAFSASKALFIAKRIVSGLEALGYTFDMEAGKEALMPRKGAIADSEERGFDLLANYPNVSDMERERAELKFQHDFEKVRDAAYEALELRISKEGKAQRRENQDRELQRKFTEILNSGGSDAEKIEALKTAAFDILKPQKPGHSPS